MTDLNFEIQSYIRTHHKCTQVSVQPYCQCDEVVNSTNYYGLVEMHDDKGPYIEIGRWECSCPKPDLTTLAITPTQIAFEKKQTNRWLFQTSGNLLRDPDLIEYLFPGMLQKIQTFYTS